ncbi:hypothetical protein [Actinoplanes sp. NPDC051851]|uniref:hypothetical protein n=1 Tax=Actinoplanes sp. NPDC051851 TaxID=3154753 RepID=UPI00341FBBAF
MDPLRLYRSDLQQLADADEAVLAAASCGRPPAGAERLTGERPDPREQFANLPPDSWDGPDRRECWWHRIPAALVGAGSLVHADVDRILGGVSVVGGPGSYAGRLWAYLDEGLVFCVVTDRRLMLAVHELDPDHFRFLTDVPVEAVERARMAGRFLQRGRVFVEFSDGSAVAIFTGVFFAARGRALVAALMGGPVG